MAGNMDNERVDNTVTLLQREIRGYTKYLPDEEILSVLTELKDWMDGAIDDISKNLEKED